MLTPEYLDSLPDALAALWQQVEDDILRDAARRIAKMDGMTDTASWQLWRLEQVRAMHRDVVGILAKYAGKTRVEVRRLLQDAGRQTLASDDELYRAAGMEPQPVSESAALQNLLNAGYRQTMGSWQNLTATTANTVTGEFEAAMDRAWLQVSSGAFDYKTAIARAVDELAAGGIRAITYPTGHRDTLEVAVRRCVLTGVNQTAAKLQLARMDEMDCAFVEVTAHAGARPEHAVWQGKVYHRGGATVYNGRRYEDFETATGYGTGPGLCGWNCRHNFYPFWPGLSDENWSAEQLAAMADPQRYDLSQRQRALERKVRDAKRRYLAADAAGADTGRAAARLKSARGELAQFLRDNGLRQDGSRERVPGFGRSEAAKAVQAAKNAFTPKRERAILDASKQIGVSRDVNYLCELNPQIYTKAVSAITTTHVIITDKQLEHIRERHPDISATVLEHLAHIIREPDYIIETEMPSTANVLKRLDINGKRYQLVLRIRTDNDPENFENSVITFMSVNEKRYRQYLRNRKILYKRESL